MAKKSKKQKSSKMEKCSPKADPRAKELQTLEANAKKLSKELDNVRREILKNEAAAKRKIDEKLKIDGELNSILRKHFASESRQLVSIKARAQKKGTSMRKKLASLKKVNDIYEGKRSKINEAKKRQKALRKQLDALGKLLNS